jgi:hypothetical protein
MDHVIIVNVNGRAGCCSGNPLRHVFGRYSVRIPAGTPAMLNEIFRAFLQTLQVNSGEVPLFGHGRFLANPFQFVSHRIVRRYLVPGLTASQGTRRHVFFVDVIAYYLCDAVT